MLQALVRTYSYLTFIHAFQHVQANKLIITSGFDEADIIHKMFNQF